jgi:hypothetical protein
MAFGLDDFRDLIELLAQHPEWRAELRRHVLSDDLLEVPALIRQLAEAQARTEARVEALVEAQARTEARVEALVEAQARTEARLAELAQAQVRTEARLEALVEAQGHIVDRLGDVEGEVLELRYARRGPAYFGPIARRLRVMETGPLADMLDDAVEDGRLTNEERNAILLADIVLTGRRRDDGQAVYLLAEISGGVGAGDVERAADRAATLAKLGTPVLPVVAGKRINEQAVEMAGDRGVWYVLGGRVTPPLPRRAS